MQNASAPIPVVGVRPLVPDRLPDSTTGRRDLAHALGRFMVANNIPISKGLRDDLSIGYRKAILYADEKIRKWENERAGNAHQTAQGGAQSTETQADNRMLAQRGERAQNGSKAVRGKSAQKQGNKKAADKGELVIADGYETESGRPLSEADPQEFIIKPNGSRNFGEITKAVSDAVMEQSGEKLPIGEIRLRVGNSSEGLIHAKAHEKQAQDAGYDSVEDMIADVAENFDRIYMRPPAKEGQRPTYSLVKSGNKSKGIMNGVAPIYFELQTDGSGNYYIVVTAIPKGDKNLGHQTKKDRLIYSSPGLGAATESNAGAVSASAKKVGAESRGGTPASDKSGDLDTSTISPEETESKENPLHEDEQAALKGLSADAKDVYRLVRDKLAGSSNKKVASAASVGAVLLARHADIIARKIRTALGKPFTAMDYYRNMFALKTEGDKTGANALHQAANAGGKMYAQSATNVPSTEKEAVRKQYEGTEQWMKTPNGKPTKLTEDQWIAVRTPAFKSWFGDWEVANALEFALHGQPVTSLTGKEFQSDGVKLTDKVPQWYQEKFGGVANHPELGTVKLDLEGVKDSMGHGMGREKAAAYAAVPYIVEHGIVYDRQANWKQRGYDTAVIIAPIKFAGQDYIGEVVVKRQPNRQGFYLHEVEITKKLESAFKTPTKGGAPQASRLIIAERLGKVNECSKIVDENGEPLVVYHGSDADFNVFDRTKGRTNMDIQGMFFSPWELDSKGYGANVRAFFLNIRKPANEGQGYKALNRRRGQNGAGVKAREDLIAAGFDGVNNSDEEFIAFEPNQIKSATDNNGAYDYGDVNIYHQSAWHGTPHDFAEFLLSAIGTGEGAQAHGWGLYFAGERSTSEAYKRQLTRNNIPDITLDGVPFGELTWHQKRLLSFFDEYGDESDFGKQRDEAIGLVQSRINKATSNTDAYQPVISFIKSNPHPTIEEVFRLLPEGVEKDELKMVVSSGRGGHKLPDRYISDIFSIYKQSVNVIKEQSGLLEQLNELDVSRIKIKQANRGKLYEVEIPNNDVLLDEQKSFDAQPKFVQEKLEALVTQHFAQERMLDRLSEKDGRYDDVFQDYCAYLDLAESEDADARKEAAEKKAAVDAALEKLLGGEPLARAFLRTFTDGRAIYQMLGRIHSARQNDKAASLALNEVGIKGITYDGRRDGRCYVIFDDKAISIINKFNQQMNEVIKGTTQDIPNGQRIISLFEAADESTFLHEMGHLFLLDLEHLAPMSPTAEKDLATVKKWAAWREGQATEYKGTPFARSFAELDKKIRAALSAGNDRRADNLKRQWEHERFARGFEMYLKTGDAPTKGLRAVFAKFRAFLQRVYQAFTGTGGKATPEVEEVMARMIAMEEESIAENIERGKKAMQTVVATHQDVTNAMERPDVGVIDFVWGNAGKGAKFKQGKGVAHILAKHVPESGTELLDQIVETIARGEIIQERTAGGSTQPRLVLEHNGYVALLSLNSEDNAWLLSGWEKYDSIQKRASSASGEGDGSTVATATAPMRSRRDGEDALSSVLNISSEKGESNKKDSPSAEDFARSADKSDGAHSTVGGNLSSASNISPNEAESKQEPTIEELLHLAPTLKKAALEYGAKSENGKVTFTDAAQEKEFLQVAKALLSAGARKFSKAWTGSAADYDVPSLDYVGTGTGGAAYGYGLYYAEKRKTAEGYGDKLYHAEIPDADVLLDAGKSFDEQPPKVRKALEKLVRGLTLEQLENWNDVRRMGKAKVVAEIMDALSEADGTNIYGTISDLVEGQKEASELLNKYGVKGAVYDDEQNGRTFVVFDDKAIKILEKFSARRQEEIKKMLDGITLVSPNRLSPRKRALRDWGHEMGVPVVFFKGDPSLHGFHSDGVTFLNVDSEITPQWTFWHEAMHWMKANNPDLYNNIVHEISGAEGFTKEQLDAYRKEIGAEHMSDADVIEEMIADALPDVRRRVPLLRDVGKRDTGIVERLVAWVHDVMRRFHDHFFTPKGGLTNDQRRAMVRAFGNLVGSIRDADGKQIFRVANDGARITLRDGKPLPAVKYSLDKAGREGDNESKISDAVFGKYLNDGIMKMVQDKVSAEIGEHVDLSAVSDPVARDAARDRLPYIRKMLADYNTNTIQNKPAYRDRLAAKIEYARRCFDNDPRVQHGAVRQVDGHDRPQDLYRTGQATLSGRNDGRGVGETGRQGTRGVSRSVSGERSGARAHFDKLYEDMRKHLESQGAFSMPKFSARTNGESRVGNFRRMMDALKTGVKPSPRVEVHDGRREVTADIGVSQVKRFMKDKRLTDDEVISRRELPNGKVRITYYARSAMDIGYADYAKSVRQVAKRNPFVKALYDLASKSMHKQEKLRNDFAKSLKEFAELVKNPADMEKVTEILWTGDATGKEYTSAELRAAGASDNVVRAYALVRRELKKAYELLNETRMQVKTRSKVLRPEDVESYMQSHWIRPSDVLSKTQTQDGNIELTWRGGKTYETKNKLMSAEELSLMEKDENINVTRAVPANAKAYGAGMYHVGYVERIKPINNLTGYMPHFFHEWMVYEQYKDPVSKEIRYTSVGSGRTLNEAVKIGNTIAEKNKDRNYVVRPKGFDMDAGNAVVVGDMEFAQMAKKLTESTQMSLADARTFLRESAGATLKSRHRFFGNMMKRKGAEGFDKNVMWVLAHYFNSSARYIAMEEFKPAAISLYERCFGAFDSEPKNMTARYCKDLINDVNGNPRGVEVWLNDLIKGTWLGKRIADSYGDRAALAVNGELSTWNAITKLGLLNFASAAVNFSQFINVGAALNDYGYAAKGLMRALHPSALDEKIIEASGLLEDINLAADNGGYSQRRGGKVRGIYSGIKNVGEKSLFLFQKADTLMRKAAVLGAYYQGVEKKGMEKAPGDELSAKAIAYAQQINDDANFDYSAANAPGMLRAGSVITQQLFQFQKYPIMQFEFMYNILKNGTRGQKVRMLVPYVLFCGIGGSIPFGELFNQLFSFLFGIATGDDEDIARDIKAEILRWAGKDPVKKSVAETALYGVLAPTFGLDISGRIGMSNAFSGEFYGQKPDSVSGVVAQQLGGPMAATAINMLHQAHEGNPIEALKAVSPALGNMAQAYVGVSRTTHHRVNTRYDSAYDKIVHAIGFRSVEESTNAFVMNYDYEMRTKDKHTKQDAIQSYIDDPSDANRRTLNALGIKDRQVKEAQIQQERTAKERAKNGRPNTNGKNRSSQHKKEVKRETLLSATDDEE